MAAEGVGTAVPVGVASDAPPPVAVGVALSADSDKKAVVKHWSGVGLGEYFTVKNVCTEVVLVFTTWIEISVPTQEVSHRHKKFSRGQPASRSVSGGFTIKFLPRRGV